MEDRIYREECKVDIQNVCEENIAVPVELYPPVQDDYGPPDLPHDHDPHYNHPYPPDMLVSQQGAPSDQVLAMMSNPDINQQPFLPQPNDPVLAMMSGISTMPKDDPNQGFQPLILQPQTLPKLDTKQQVLPPLTNDQVLAMMREQQALIHNTTNPYIVNDPSQGFLPEISSTSTLLNPGTNQQAFPPVVRRIRGKRNSDVLGGTLVKTNPSDEMLKDAVKQVLHTMFEKNQQLGEVNATVKQGTLTDPVNFHLKLPPVLPYHPVHDLLPELPPVITTQELPAPPGCRSIATKECIKIPVSVPRQVPYSVCRTVPDIECVHVLKTVPELECTPKVFQDCAEYEQRIPYLEEDDECEEIFYDECFEVRKVLKVRNLIGYLWVLQQFSKGPGVQ